MDDHFFGRQPPEGVETVANWGARAIFPRNRVIDIVGNRQQARGDAPTRQELVAWINERGLPEMRERAKRLYHSDHTVIAYDDGRFHIEASPQSSGGYLYIGAWMI